MQPPQNVLAMLPTHDGKAPPYAVSIITKEEARSMFSEMAKEGFDVTDALNNIEAAETLYRLKEEGGFQTEILYNEAGAVLLWKGTKPK